MILVLKEQTGLTGCIIGFQYLFEYSYQNQTKAFNQNESIGDV